VRDGLIYVSDINQGLYVLRYGGPHQEQVARVAFAEGNSNLSKLRSVAPSPTAAPATSGKPVPNRSAVPAPRASAAIRPPLVVAAGLVALALVAGIAALALIRRRTLR
jgi:hypothetical protein